MKTRSYSHHMDHSLRPMDHSLRPITGHSLRPITGSRVHHEQQGRLLGLSRHHAAGHRALRCGMRWEGTLPLRVLESRRTSQGAVEPYKPSDAHRTKSVLPQDQRWESVLWHQCRRQWHVHVAESKNNQKRPRDFRSVPCPTFLRVLKPYYSAVYGCLGKHECTPGSPRWRDSWRLQLCTDETLLRA